MKLGAVIGMGLGYATSNRDDFKDCLAEIINDENLPIEVSANAALSLSLIFVAQRNEDVINTILSSLMIFSPTSLNNKCAKFFGIALALNFLGEQNSIDAVKETL